MKQGFDWPIGHEDKLVILFGAGATVSDTLPKNSQLPLGSDLRDRLISESSTRQSLDTKKPIENALGKSIAKSTFDEVWQVVVKRQHGLPSYYPTLRNALTGKPVPYTYNILAHLFFKCPSLGALATINFDPLIDEAIKQVGQLNRSTYLTDYSVISTESQFDYLSKYAKPSPKFLLKLHGTLDDPHSILAGVPRRGTAKASGSPLIYEYFLNKLKEASHLIILGYSFRDRHLSEHVLALLKASHNKVVHVVCGPDSERIAKRLKSRSLFVKAHSGTAEQFLRGFVQQFPFWSEMGNLTLSPYEKSTILHGPDAQLVDTGGRHLSKTARSSSKDLADGIKFPDPIYGSAVFDSSIATQIAACIDSAEFQRLQWIKQLSFVYYKHRSANHSRFAHSVGVAHLANLYCEQHQEQITNETRVDIVLAALFHDLGHGPLGHTVDSLQPHFEGLKEHHNISAQIIKDATLGKALGDIDLLIHQLGLRLPHIAAIIEDKSNQYHWIIDNSGLDVDRLDFILRDSFYCRSDILGYDKTWLSTRLGSDDPNTDIKRLLKCFNLSKDDGRYYFQISHEKDKSHECRNYTLIHALADVYVKLYDRVYYGHENACGQAMMAKAMQRILESGRYRLSDILPMTDDEVFSEVMRFDDAAARQLATLSKFRRLYDHAFTITFPDPPREFPIKKIESALNNDNKFHWLCAFRKEKRFKVRLRDTRLGGPDQEWDHDFNGIKADARLLGFVWPEHRVDKDQLLKLLNSIVRDFSNLPSAPKIMLMF